MTRVATKKTAKKKVKAKKIPVNKKPTKKGFGRPVMVPTSQQRTAVEALRERSMSISHISSVLKINERSLAKHFKKELGLCAKGRPRFEPTDGDRERVKKMAGFGLTQSQMASVIINPSTEKHIDRETLQDVFPTELKTGAVVANEKVAMSLYEKATGKGSQSVTAAIWWTKVRMGWRGESLELTGKDGGPIETASTDAPKERLEALIMRQREAMIIAGARNGGDPSNN